MTQFNAKNLLWNSGYLKADELPTEIQEEIATMDERDMEQSLHLDDAGKGLAEDVLLNMLHKNTDKQS